jgi:hypothetical protein
MECVLWEHQGATPMSKITDKLIFDFIRCQYHPYDRHEEFGRGFLACQAGNCRNPHEAQSLSAQAWDRGVGVAMHYKKATA